MPLTLAMPAAGFYPRGGGRLEAWVEPASPRPWVQLGRGPLRRIRGLQVHALQFSYEKAGLRVAGEPVPWSAEATLVDAVIGFPPEMAWRKSDFQLRIAGSHPALANSPCVAASALR